MNNPDKPNGHFHRTVKIVLKRPSTQPKKFAPRGLSSIPGIGPSLAQDLRDIGIKRPSCLKGKNPEKLYQKLIALHGAHQDRCVLYTFRCAVYYAEGGRETEKLKWWNWKDAV